LIRNLASQHTKAEDAVDALSGMIQQVPDNPQVLAQRLLSIEIRLNTEQPLTSHYPRLAGKSQRPSNAILEDLPLKKSCRSPRSIRDLTDKVTGGPSRSSAPLAGLRMVYALGLSLSDNISIIVVQALPVYAHDLSNAEVYQFGEFNDSGLVLIEASKRTSMPESLVVVHIVLTIFCCLGFVL
jgi:hypothetical protein